MKISDHTVYVHGPSAPAYMHMFQVRGAKLTSDFDKASIICWTGGEDVNPVLYNENNLILGNRGISHFNPRRDDVDALAFGVACANDQIKVGICRGGQFLNVMNGGKMWQHVGGHANGREHDLIDTITGEVVSVTSTHHQMMRPATDGEVLAIAKEAPFRMAENETWTRVNCDGHDEDDVEVVWYPETKSLCFQPHPEFNPKSKCADYFFNLIERHCA